MPDWIVKLTDESGKAVTDAEVALVREAEVSTRFVHAEVIPKNGSSGAPLPLMKHDADGTYRLPAPLSGPTGDWRLVVRKDGRHTVIQPVTITASDKGGFATTPRNLDAKGPKVEVSAVEIKTVHAAGTSTTTFLVRPCEKLWRTVPCSMPGRYSVKVFLMLTLNVLSSSDFVSLIPFPLRQSRSCT